MTRKWQHSWRSAPLVGLCIVANLVASAALADWVDLMPQPFENGAFLDGYTSYERDHLSSGGRTNHWDDLFFREKLTLYSDGYWYHPRFLQYRFSIAGAQRQENYQSSGLGSTGWNDSSGLEYDATLYFLPEHPYNLEVFARRYEPLFKEQAATQHSNVQNRRGFNFRYREKPYFFHTGFVNDTVDSGSGSSEVNRLNVDGQYFKRFVNGNEVSFNGVFNPTWFSTSDNLNGDSTEYGAGNYLSLQEVPWRVPVRITSNVTQTYFDQDSPSSGKLKNDQFIWYEWATLTLPLHFRSDLYYRHQENDATFSGDKQSYTNDDLRADLIHRLYESLDSTYTYIDNSQSSPGGDSSFIGHTLVFNYTKLIPFGRVLIGTNLGTGETDTRGQIDVLNESFSGAVPMIQPYVLGKQNVDQNSIKVFLKSPLPPFDIVFLDPSFYYVIPEQNTYGIQVHDVPAIFAGNQSYDFFVSYSSSGDFALRTNNLGANASVELFDTLLTPYFSYQVVTSDVVSGVFPGVPIDSTTYTTGLLVRYAGLQVRGEYQKLEWQISPYEQWKGEVQYVHSLDDETSLFASGAYINKHYPHGTSEFYTDAFTEQTETATASVQRQFFLRSLFVSLGGSYAHVNGLIDSDASSVNSSVLWKIGKMDLTVGANAYMSDSSGSVGERTKRDHQFFWANLRRRLF